jgi:hypothetical protein
MICGLALMTFVLPANLNQGQSMAWVTKPYLVQAVIDSARIIGLPSSKAAKAYAKKIQMPDPAIQQITYVPDPVSDRKLFFRSYFK